MFPDKALSPKYYRIEKIRRGALDFETIPLGNYCSDVRHLKVDAECQGWEGSNYHVKLHITCHREPASYERYNSDVARKFGIESKIKLSNVNLLKSNSYLTYYAPETAEDLYRRQMEVLREKQQAKLDQQKPWHQRLFERYKSFMEQLGGIKPESEVSASDLKENRGGAAARDVKEILELLEAQDRY